MKKIKSFITNPLFAGSAVLVAGSNITNVLSYVYHLILGRMLGPAEYGELVTVISVFGLLIAFFGFLNIVIIKFVSGSKENEVSSLIFWFDKKAEKLGFIFAMLLISLTPVIAWFIKINYMIILLLAPLMFFSIKKTVFLSSLNGLLRFKEAVIGTTFETLARLVISILLVYMGLSVFGAFSGFLLSALLSIFVFMYFLRDKFKKKGRVHEINHKDVFSYSFPIFLNSIAMMSFFSSDVILVKHFFSAYDVGIYGALSNMGKIIFYALAPVGAVMFPIISKRAAKGEDYISIFFLSCLLVGLGVFVVLAAYKFFPVQMITLLFGSQFVSGTSYLFSFGLIMSIFSFDNLVVTYYISREKLKPILAVSAAAIFQIVGIVVFHRSLQNVINVSLASVLILSLGLVIYFVYEKRYEKQKKID